MSSPDAAPRLLRDRTYLTRLLVLRELHANPRSTLREVGATLDVTVQAVSNYVKALTTDGLVREARDAYPLTPAGVQYLLDGLGSIKRAVDEAVAPLAKVDATSAVALAPVQAGEHVELLMADGDLAARPLQGDAASHGVATATADAGHELVVRDLAGVVRLEPGHVRVLEVPGPAEGGGARIDPAAATRWLKEHAVTFDRVAAHGTGAKVLVRRMGIPLAIEFAAPTAAFNAAEVGLDVLLLVTRDLLKDALARLDGLNRDTLARVRVELVGELPGTTP